MRLPFREPCFPIRVISISAAVTTISRKGIERSESRPASRIRQIYNFGPLCPPTHALDNPSMAAGTRNVRLFVSEQCFALLVDAMASFSKQTRRFQTMRMTVQAACSRLKTHGISRSELAEFLAEYPIDGDIRIHLEVTPEWSADYDAMRAKVREISEKAGSDKALVPFAVYLAVKHNLL